jgi:hypothetical protein
VDDLELCHAGGMQMYHLPSLESSLAASLKAKHPSVSHPSIQKKTYGPTKTCTQMFIAAFFVTAPNWKQPNYHLMDNTN